ncbi:OmpA family protein [Vaginella massiliensis]|uniref:OmpA family protein n=1 Tax=Vaginella massiliensis TaxID=1816680 RepID=UPI0008393188|nr:OmpA family protein [Vaginella massiliensis]
MKNKIISLTLVAAAIFVTSCSCDLDQKENSTNAVAPTVKTENSKNLNLDENNNYVYQLGEFSDVVLPNNDTLNVGELSTESKLVSQLNDADFKVSEDKTKGWITLDRIYFETAKANVTETSATQVDNLAKILKAYPSATVKIGGYTDNVGDSIVNAKISQERAEKVANLLVSKGVAATRIEAEGYGAQHFLCEANDTEVCKAQNRRVDIRITKK